MPAGFPGIPGEAIITRLDAPGGGCWYITNYGGVAAVGGASFRGNPLQNGNEGRIGPGYENPPRYIVSAYTSGPGYVMVSNRNETYRY
ncbi:MAG: hypothetical protein ACRDZ3_20835 [Acidimicrobiia bacterium]